MEITPEILKRYNNGTATVAENAAVELWLENDDQAESTLLPDELQEMRSEVWSNIQNITQNGNEVISGSVPKIGRLYTKVAAAAVLLFLFSAGIYQKFNSTLLDHTTSEGVVFTSGKGPMEVLGNHFKIEFSGYLQIINKSHEPKSIECINGEKYTLAPGQTYYMETIAGRNYLIAEETLSPEDNYVRFVTGDVEVFTETI
ncbi:hypothetical protein [Sphingobacterium anhuiense]|uniref:FecR protein n=1 Tax=Sphingobacterium anhuiense TaxID=493780 RepID=A0ABW5YZK3_9SPHI